MVESERKIENRREKGKKGSGRKEGTSLPHPLAVFVPVTVICAVPTIRTPETGYFCPTKLRRGLSTPIIFT